MAKKRKTVKPKTPPHAEAMVDNHPATVIKDLRQTFRDAFDMLGGVEWLVTFARGGDQNARVFVQAIARMMPLELTGKDGAPLTVIVQQADGTQVPVEVNAPIEGEGRRVH